MKVFISWSGEKSKAAAEALRDWLPLVIQSITPWMSRKDIAAGASWNKALAKELGETKYGIVCLTKMNVNEPWIHFETGAISKTINGDAFVCPYRKPKCQATQGCNETRSRKKIKHLPKQKGMAEAVPLVLKTFKCSLF
jgi:hypothetical protein